jgi:hypothetical protein
VLSLLREKYYTYIIVLAIILFPLQKLAILLMGSRYDLTAFILLFLGIYSFIFYKNSIESKIYALLFFSTQILTFTLINAAPYYRFISGMVWLGGLLLLLIGGKHIKYNQDKITKSIIIVLFISGLYIIFQSFFLQIDRPQAWFYEPSFAGLCLYSAASGILLSLIFVKFEKKPKYLLIIIFSILFCAAVLTFSMHFLTFVVSIALFFLLLITILLSVDFTKVIIFLFFGLLIFIIGSNLFLTSHFQSRTDISDPTNLSLLAWLQGLDQMKASVIQSPIVGFGLGSTGYVNFKSDYADILQSIGKGDLTLNDAFSLSFRLIIEIGLPFFIIFLVYLKKKMLDFKIYFILCKKHNDNLSFSVVFNFVFSITIILGCFLKEPLYPNSFLYLSIFLLASTPLFMKNYL